MNKFILVLFFLCGSAPAFAQPATRISLAGKVVDAQTGEALAGANILLAEARLGVVTDSGGTYVIKNIPSGHHTIEVSYSGFNTLVVHMDILQSTVRNFSIAPSVKEQLGVTITGVAHATSIRNAPIPVTVMRRQEMMQTPATNIIDLISRQPGVSQVSTGPAVSKPVIRGLGFNRVVVVNDGVRQEGQQWGEEHGVEIDELSVNRAEVLKGPASLMYGSDALAGVINFITNVAVPEGTVRGNVFSNYQSNNGLFGLNANLAGNQNGFNWNVYGTTRSAGDYRNRYDGNVLNSRFKERNFGGYVGLNKSWGFSHLIVSAFNQDLGLVEGRRDAATGKFLLYADSPLERIANGSDYEGHSPLAPYQNVRHYKILSDNNFNVGRHRVKLNLGFQNNLRKEFGDPENAGMANLYFDLKTVTYNLQWTLPQIRDWQTTLGVSGMQQSNRNRGEETIIPAYSLFDIGAFVFTQRFFDKTTLTGGLRFDNRFIDSKELLEGGTTKFAPFSRNFSNVSGSAGISYRPTDIVTLKGNIAKGFRAPALSELASNGAHEGTYRYEVGQQNLRSEKSFQADAGIEVDYVHFNLSLNAFYNHINDFIFYRRLQNTAGNDSIIVQNGQEFQAFQFNQNTARLAGIEVVLDIHPHPLDWLHVENTLSFVRGTFTSELDGSKNLPQIPPVRLNSELRASFQKTGKSLRNVYFLVETSAVSRQIHPFTGYNTETETPGYVLLNSGAGADFVSKKGTTLASLHLALNNITDKAYQDHLSRLKYTDVNEVTGRQGVYNMGRNFSVKLNVPLSFK
ncbi:MAG TPA: TonB-dependent receptor [Flavisolibacter sp.]|nr:TonB-dependent receptor [Flavisolibacter sp.]